MPSGLCANKISAYNTTNKNCNRFHNFYLAASQKSEVKIFLPLLCPCMDITERCAK